MSKKVGDDIKERRLKKVGGYVVSRVRETKEPSGPTMAVVVDKVHRLQVPACPRGRKVTTVWVHYIKGIEEPEIAKVKPEDGVIASITYYPHSRTIWQWMITNIGSANDG